MSYFYVIFLSFNFRFANNISKLQNKMQEY